MSLAGLNEKQVGSQLGVILLEQQFNLQQRTRLMTLPLLLQDVFNRIQVRLRTLTWSTKSHRDLTRRRTLSQSRST